jgi:hypothetical protein
MLCFSLVYNFHSRTVSSAGEIVGVLGKNSFRDLSPDDIVRRVRSNNVRTLSELFPEVENGCLRDGKGPERLQEVWNLGGTKYASSGSWIY